MGPLVEPIADDDRLALARHILLDDDAVRATRHGRAGEDPERFARPDLAAPGPARRRLAHHAEPGARHGIGAPHRVAVHGRGREGRLIARREDRLGQHAAAASASATVSPGNTRVSARQAASASSTVITPRPLHLSKKYAMRPLPHAQGPAS